MFSVLMLTLGLLFGSGDVITLSPEFVSCRSWTHDGVVARQVWCLCHTFGDFDFCAGDLAAVAPFLEVYPSESSVERPYLHMRLQLDSQ